MSIITSPKRRTRSPLREQNSTKCGSKTEQKRIQPKNV